MTCSIHPSDPGAGVCAFCLRKRLSILAASIDGYASPELRYNPDSSSPASPLKIRADSAFPVHQSPVGNRIAEKFSFSSPSLITNAESLKSSRSNASCLLDLVRCPRMKVNSKTSPHVAPAAVEATRGRARRPRAPPLSGRGLSPATREAMDLHSPDIGNVKEISPIRWLSTPPSWQKARTTATAPKYNAHKNQSPQSISGFSLCLSPLMRPSSGNRRSRMPAEMTSWSGGGPAAGVPSFLVPNRSRKLADFGKVW